MKVNFLSVLCLLILSLINLEGSMCQSRRGFNSRTPQRPSTRYRPTQWRGAHSLSSTTINNQRISSNIYFNDGKLYYFNNTAVTFNEAKSFCELVGMTMVHVRSEEENKFIATFRNCTFSGIWFGVKRSDEDPSLFVWLDSSNITVEVPKEDSYYDQCSGMSRNSSSCCSMRQCRYSDCTPCHKWFASPCEQTHMIACEAVVDINLIRKVLADKDNGETQFLASSGSDQVDLLELRREMDVLRNIVESKTSQSNIQYTFLVFLVIMSLVVVAVVGYKKFKYLPAVTRGRENITALFRSTSNRIESLNKSLYSNTRSNLRMDNDYASMVEEPISCEGGS